MRFTSIMRAHALFPLLLGSTRPLQLLHCIPKVCLRILWVYMHYTTWVPLKKKKKKLNYNLLSVQKVNSLNSLTLIWCCKSVGTNASLSMTWWCHLAWYCEFLGHVWLCCLNNSFHCLNNTTRISITLKQYYQTGP